MNPKCFALFAQPLAHLFKKNNSTQHYRSLARTGAAMQQPLKHSSSCAPPLSVTIDHSDQHFISGGGHGVALSLCLRVPQTPHIIFLIIMQR